MRHTPALPLALSMLGYRSYAMNREKFILPPLCAVPAGPFLMGSDPTQDLHARDDEMPQHHVSLYAFEMAQFPVIVAEYACAIKAHIVPEPYKWHHQLTHPNRPVVNLAWRHALAYADWLARTLDEPWCLPTEAQWEKAARGTEGRIYAWGDTWTVEQASDYNSAIGQHPTGASPYGVQDLLGNVHEWVTSYVFPYPYDPTDGREDLTPHEDNKDRKQAPDGSEAARGARGGYDAFNIERRFGERAACRKYHWPSVNYEDEYGFRVVRGSRSTDIIADA